MATTYKASPFATPGLQSYIVKGVEVNEVGKIDATGTSGSVYTMHITGGGATNHVLLWDAVTTTDEEADIVIPIVASEDLVVYIDKGITFLTAITFAASSVPQGGVAPADSGNNLNVNLFIN